MGRNLCWTGFFTAFKERGKALEEKGAASGKLMAGKANLEKSALEPALKALKDRLMPKNVAEEIGEKLCESVVASLEGKKLASFTRISSTVHVCFYLLPAMFQKLMQVAMEEAVVRILTPRRFIDILRDVHVCQGAKEAVAYWLQQHNVKVMMAACDTFPSKAVEQLRTHARRLQIPTFEKGYEKDPAVGRE